MLMRPQGLSLSPLLRHWVGMLKAMTIAHIAVLFVISESKSSLFYRNIQNAQKETAKDDSVTYSQPYLIASL